MIKLKNYLLSIKQQSSIQVFKIQMHLQTHVGYDKGLSWPWSHGSWI